MKDPTKFVPKPAAHLDLFLDQCLTRVGVHACVYVSVFVCNCIRMHLCVYVCLIIRSYACLCLYWDYAGELHKCSYLYYETGYRYHKC